jgi:ABC-type antimicrobial peptide transport system permease subunit
MEKQILELLETILDLRKQEKDKIKNVKIFERSIDVMSKTKLDPIYALNYINKSKIKKWVNFLDDSNDLMINEIQKAINTIKNK